MALGNWKFHDQFLEKIGNSTINLESAIFRASLYKSTANLSAGAVSSLSVIGSVTNEVNASFGYAASGKTLSATTWSVGASGGAIRFDASAVFWSANGGTITSIQYMVIWAEGASANARHIAAHITLSTSIFALTDTNRLTLTPAALGIFNLTQA